MKNKSHHWKERFTRFENDLSKIQGDTAFLKLQNLLRNVWDVGMRSRLTLSHYKLTKHSMQNLLFLKCCISLNFLSDYFQTWQICWFYDPLSRDANDFTVASDLKFRMNCEMGYLEIDSLVSSFRLVLELIIKWLGLVLKLIFKWEYKQSISLMLFSCKE